MDLLKSGAQYNLICAVGDRFLRMYIFGWNLFRLVCTVFLIYSNSKILFVPNAPNSH